MPPCLHCHAKVDDGYKLTPFTVDKLRWYLGGAAEAAMGVRSTHQAFENMMNAGPSSGGVNLPEIRMTDARLAAAGLERCVRAHRLAGVEAHHMAVLRAAYSGEDWTRLLDERVGKGPRLELQRLFTHELLQIAPLTMIAVRGASTPPPHEEAGAPVYRSGAATLASFRRVLALPADASAERVRGRMSSLATWVKTGKAPRWMEPGMREALGVLVTQPGEHEGPAPAEMVKRARRMFGAALRLEATPEASRGVSYVAREVVRTKPAATPQTYLLDLLRLGKRRVLDDVKKQADKLLKDAREAARVVEPEPSRRVRTSRHVPRAAVTPIYADTFEDM